MVRLLAYVHGRRQKENILLVKRSYKYCSILTHFPKSKYTQTLKTLKQELYYLNFTKFSALLNAGIASNINFLTLVSELLVVFFGVGYCSRMILFTYTVLFTRNGGSDLRILQCKVGNSGMSKATVWFCTCLGKLCHKGDRSLKSLGFK